MPIMGQPPSKKDIEIANAQSGTLKEDETFDSYLLKKKYTTDTFHNRTALNQSRLDPILKKLQTYSVGAPIVVTYFSSVHNYGNKQTNTSDYSFALNNIHKIYDKINNFEIRLNGGMETSTDDETGETVVEGTGKIIGGFLPAVGDIFLYELFPGQIGLFLVSNTPPLGLHREAAYEVSFVLKEYATNEVIEKLEQCVVQTYYYGKQTVMGESVIMLSRTDYLDFQKILSFRREMIKYFLQNFYRSKYQSVERPDKIYDPYMVSFFNKIVSFEDCAQEDTSVYPLMQLANEREANMPNILDNFTEGLKIFGKNKMIKYNIYDRCFNILSSVTNSLHNNKYLVLETTGKINYIFSDLFYNNDINNVDIDPFEKFILTYLRDKTIPIPELLTYIEGVVNEELLVQFYRIPILIHLCNILIVNL